MTDITGSPLVAAPAPAATTTSPATPSPAAAPSAAGNPPGPALPAPIDPREIQAWSLFGAADYPAALAGFGTVLAAQPASVGSLQGRAGALRKLRRFDEAARALDAALAVHAQEPGLLAERAWLALDERRFDGALAALDAVIATGQADEGIHLWKVAVLRHEHRYPEARQALAAARLALPGAPRLATEDAWLTFHQKSYDEANRAFDAILAQDAGDASAWQGKVASLRKLERFAEADEASGLALRHCPGAPGIYAERGWIAFDRGDFEGAERAFAGAAAAAPQDAQLKVCLAAALIGQDDEADREDAEQQCRAALMLDPDLAEAHGCLGIIAFKRGRLRDAERHLVRSTEIDPINGRHADLGALYAQTGRLAEAQASFKRAIANDPDDGFAHIQLGSLLLQQDKRKLAVNEFRIALALCPANPEAHRAFAVGLVELGRLDEAELALRGALRRLDAGRRAELHLALAQLLVRVGDDAADKRFYEDALKEVGLALADRPKDGPSLFYRGVIKFKLGDLTGAMASFQRTLERDRDHLQAELNRQHIGSLLKQERKLTGASRIASVFLSAVFLVHLVALWWLFVVAGQISATVFAALLPVLLGLLVVASLLPWLSRLKLTGIEAELSVPKAADSLAAGPQGTIRFGDATPRTL